MLEHCFFCGQQQQDSEFAELKLSTRDSTAADCCQPLDASLAVHFATALAIVLAWLGKPGSIEPGCASMDVLPFLLS